MNIKIRHSGINFEWDSYKAAANIRKHGIYFETACETFFDPFVLYLEDEFVNDELRETIIGMTVNWQLLCVVYVLYDDVIRVISARKSTGAERKKYEAR